MGDPMHVYPDPNGGSNGAVYAPSDTRLSGASIVSGAVAAGAAATGLGPALITNALVFIQGASNGQAPEVARALGVHGLRPSSVVVILIFGSLSVVLQVVNLVIGLRMKERLRKFSQQVCEACVKAGILKA